MEKRLYRSRRDRILGGVCGGIAEYFGLDPSLVRIVAVLLILVGGGAILAYIIAWILIPEEPKGEDERFTLEGSSPAPGESRKEPGRHMLAWFLVIIGALWLSQYVVPLWGPWTPWVRQAFLPVLLIVGGVLLLVRR
ncbi:PspC domain-containing protein [Candidatus Caldatribacterium sp. SIUC1]|uniref:PspC domain-containing protein n=1 Tax=Candidatus Caldatribacterium sp. SIUC1 TaxID=3418365 RepID=UPI003F691518